MRFHIFFSCALVVWVGRASAQEVEVPDRNLEKAIRQALELPVGRAFAQQEMLRLERLSTWDSEITDLIGLEHATFLKNLRIPTPHSMTLYLRENA